MYFGVANSFLVVGPVVLVLGFFIFVVTGTVVFWIARHWESLVDPHFVPAGSR